MERLRKIDVSCQVWILRHMVVLRHGRAHKQSLAFAETRKWCLGLVMLGNVEISRIPGMWLGQG